MTEETATIRLMRKDYWEGRLTGWRVIAAWVALLVFSLACWAGAYLIIRAVLG